jgi:hypothetical protein
MSEELNTTETRWVSWGGSWGNTESVKATMKITAKANRETKRGCFEIYDEETRGDAFYCEGGLWFDDDGFLDDYDGVYSLDIGVTQWLDSIGMISPDPTDFHRQRLNKEDE